MIIAKHQYHQCHQSISYCFINNLKFADQSFWSIACCLYNKCLFIPSFYKIHNIFLNRQTIVFLIDN